MGQLLRRENIAEFVRNIQKSVKKWLNDLVTQNHELTGAVDNLTDRYYKIDNLAEKIDASVNIIAGLKTVIADNDEQNTQDLNGTFREKTYKCRQSNRFVRFVRLRQTGKNSANNNSLSLSQIEFFGKLTK